MACWDSFSHTLSHVGRLLWEIPGFATTSTRSLQSEVGKSGCDFPPAPTTFPFHAWRTGDVLTAARAARGAASQHGSAQLLLWILSVLHGDGVVPLSSTPKWAASHGLWRELGNVPGEVGVGVNHSKAPSLHSSRDAPLSPQVRGTRRRSLLQPCSDPRAGGTSLVWELWGSLGLILGQPCSGCLPRVLPWSLLRWRSTAGGIQVSPYTRGSDGCFTVGRVEDTAVGRGWERGIIQPGDSRDPGLNRAAPPPSPQPPFWPAERKCLQNPASGDFLQKGRDVGASWALGVS